MKEIGGYIELDTYHLPMLHEGAIALNCGRNALAYLIKAKRIKKIWIPKFICDSVTGVCEREGVEFKFYSIGLDFLPAIDVELQDDEWFYFVNYYSQFSNEKIAECVKKYKRVIVDQAQSYFQEPIPGVDTLYTCRKYFGVADGAFLYTDTELNEELPKDESFDRMRFLLGRYERTASEFYSEYVVNNEFFIEEPIKQMSLLTSNLLHGIDYAVVENIRIRNFEYLHEKFKNNNQLELKNISSFMYPLMINNGVTIRKQLQEKKVYIPTLWSNVFASCSSVEIEYQLAGNILPLPIDQRYGISDMKYLVDLIMNYID